MNTTTTLAKYSAKNPSAAAEAYAQRSVELVWEDGMGCELVDENLADELENMVVSTERHPLKVQSWEENYGYSVKIEGNIALFYDYERKGLSCSVPALLDLFSATQYPEDMDMLECFLKCAGGFGSSFNCVSRTETAKYYTGDFGMSEGTYALFNYNDARGYLHDDGITDAMVEVASTMFEQYCDIAHIERNRIEDALAKTARNAVDGIEEREHEYGLESYYEDGLDADEDSDDEDGD